MNAEYVASDASHVSQRKQSRLSRKVGLNERKNVFDDKHLLAETDYCREQEKETEA